MSSKRSDFSPSLPKRDIEAGFNRRALVLSASGAVAMGAVGARIIYLQADAERYSAERDENRFDMRVIIPPRGVLYDRFGEQLAVTSQDLRVTMVPERAGDIAATVLKVAEILGLSDDWVASRVRDARRARRFNAVMLHQGLTWEQFNAINVRLPELPGVNAETGITRRYPLDFAFAHPIGYVQRPNDADMQRLEAAGRSPTYMRHPDVRVGKTGLEAGLEELLHGEPGVRRVQVNASGRVIRESGGGETPAQPGSGVVLTLDADLQRLAMERMAGESAAAVVMDVVEGDILVMASSPGFNPNAFVNGISTQAFRALNEPEAVGPDAEMRNLNRLFHKAVTGAYKPGSTFKMVTALAALKAGLPEDFRVNCPGYLPFGGRNFHCWKRGGHGTVDMHQALRQSCNVFFFRAAMHAGPDRVAEMARLLGLGEAYDVDLPGVEDGIIPDTSWWRRVRGGEWPPGNTLNIGIGQGDVQVSPLQLAVMTARLANGGRAVMPRLVREAPGRTAPGEAAALGIDPAHMAKVQGGMYAVCNEYGTAWRAGQLGLVRHPDTGEILEAGDRTQGFAPIQIAGKTGTAQVRIITAAERARGVRRNQDLDWEFRDHALFVCYGPYDDPRYACAVIVEHGGGGSAVAAPIASDLMKRLLLRDPAKRRAASLASLQAVRGGAPA